jgi:hypothetical protein
MNGKQKLVTAIGGLVIAFVLLRPPGYDKLEYGDIGYDSYAIGEQYSSVSQDWIFEHDEIAGGYLAFEILIIAGLWGGGYQLAKDDS